MARSTELIVRHGLYVFGGTLFVFLAALSTGAAQDRPAHPAGHQFAGDSAAANENLAAQIQALREKVARLEAALGRGHAAKPSSATGAAGMPGMAAGGRKMGPGMMGMGGMEGMDREQMMKMMQQMMGGTQGVEGGGMSGMMGAEMMAGKGMQMMGDMKGMSGMSMPSALPGFPGASHIYHIGATGFFLDHPEHLALTAKQQTDLNRVKENALLDQASSQRKIDEAEQELWTLTGSDQPDAAKIDAKVREIEKLRGDQRLEFIRAVGEAAKVLTEDQRNALLGTSVEKPGAAAQP